MKKTYLMVFILVILVAQVVFAGYYPDSAQQTQDMVRENIPTIRENIPANSWYLEIFVGVGTLVLGAAGLWLKYRKK